MPTNKKIPLVKAGDAITARYANSLAQAINELAQVTNNNTRGARKKAALLPFGVNLYQDNPSDPPTYYVTVNDGRVIELNRAAPEAVDAIILHEANNRLSLGDHTKVSVELGDKIYIEAQATANGELSVGNVAIIVSSSDLVSLNYIPTIQDGIYYYKLAEIISTDGSYRLKHFCSGSNIYHESGLTADFRLMTCPDPVDPEAYPAEQVLRLRFCSGRLAGIDEDEEEIPLSDNVSEANIEICT